MLGPRIGPRVGPRVGAAVGVSADPISGASGAAAPVLLSITVTPALPSIPYGSTQQMVATGHYDTGPDQVITGSVVWSSGSPSKATISGGGLITPVFNGTSLATATLGAVSGSTTATITHALVSIDVTPHTPTVAIGATQQFAASALYDDGDIAVVTGSVAWASVTTSVATISAGGLGTMVIAGTSSITATSGAIVGGTTVTVPVATDGPSSAIYVPARASDFTALGLTAPTSLYGCQDASGGVVDSIAGINFAVTGTIAYQQAKASWTRKAIRIATGAANLLTATLGINPNAASFAALRYLDITAKPSATTRVYFQLGSSPLMISSVNQVPTIAASTTTTGTGTADPTTAGVVPHLLLWNRAAGIAKLYTLSEKLTATYTGLVAGATCIWGSTTTVQTPHDTLWSAHWEGAACETAFPSDAAVKAYLQTLGWAPSWS